MIVKQMKNPRVSIIITTYNRAALIGESIQSVLAQSFVDWELVIIDDGSGDETREVVESFSDRRIRFIEAGRIGRGGKLKNIAMQHCRGELIAFLDADDLWEESKLEKQVKALDSHAGEGFCLTGGYNFIEQGLPTEYFYDRNEGEYVGSIFHSIFRSELALFIQALLVRRQCIETMEGFNEELIFADADMVARLAQQFTAVLLYEPLFFRRIHDRNYSSPVWEETQHEGMEMIRRFRRKKQIPRALAMHALFNAYINYGEKLLLKQQRWSALQQFIRAWMNRPLSIVVVRKLGKVLVN